MVERVCNFGPDGSIHGILTLPASSDAVPGAPIALILNAGIVHRIGPFRLHVDIARLLASKGFSTLRMDLSGLGNSAPRKGKFESEQRSQLDVSDAMDYLKREEGIDKFVLLGLCSGAYNAHQVAVKDQRIIGSVFIDGIVFRTVGFYLRSYLRFLRYRFWRNAIKRRLVAKGEESESEGNRLGESEFFGSDLSQRSVVADLKGLLKRGVQMLFLYNGGYDDICGRSQFKEMYGLRPDNCQLQVDYYPNSEHTFRLIEHRKVACERVANWFADRFGNKSETRSQPISIS
jgi:pimeloyl-ACP methyl ester carboxylesterase